MLEAWPQLALHLSPVGRMSHMASPDSVDGHVCGGKGVLRIDQGSPDTGKTTIPESRNPDLADAPAMPVGGLHVDYNEFHRRLS